MPAQPSVVSLLPSATEIICLLGARDQLLGVSHECDFPAAACSAGLPQLTAARTTLTSSHGAAPSSALIDQTVRDLVSNALAIYDLDASALAALQPDVIITQDLCHVCAVSFAAVCSAVDQLTHKHVNIVSLQPMLLEHVWSDVMRIGAALGRHAEAALAVADLRARVDELAKRAALQPRAPSVLTIEWLSPVMISGLWLPELITLAHATPLVTQPGEHAPTLTRAQLATLDPDVVVIKPCGFKLERTLEELPVLRDALPWQQYSAVRAGHVYVADGNAYFNRPGPRLVESLEILAACAHPGAFSDLRHKHRDSVVRVDSGLARHAFDAPRSPV
ncbi:MAG: hypothetical protein RL701_4086 [Pseudomonadota bacterium]|jgi:iron complex transport system substrate-binding protein